MTRIYNACKLTDEQVYFALTRNDLSIQQVADLLEVSFSTIQNVRSNKRYAHLFPEIERKRQRVQGPRCNQCVHWLREQCSLDLPEPAEQGITAAALCVAFAQGRIL